MFLPTGLCLLLLISWSNGQGPVWKWECKQGQCLKFRAGAEDKDALSLAACRLFCGDYGTLWPRPTGELSLGNFLLHLNPNSVDVLPTIADAPSSELVRKAAQRFKNNIDALAPNSDYKPGGRSLVATVDIKNPEITGLTLETDESYILKVSETSDGRVNATVTADNYFGARHGLETLGQLIIYDDIRKEMQIVRDVSITDKPAYPYRGILLDTARNYITVNSIKRTLEGMASSKLNTFHWRKTWHDIRCRIRSKSMRLTNCSGKADDNLASDETLNAFEIEVLSLIGETALLDHQNLNTTNGDVCIKSDLNQSDTIHLLDPLQILVSEFADDEMINDRKTKESDKKKKHTQPVTKRQRLKSLRQYELKMKDKYFKRKLQLLERDVIAKERIAIALETIVNSRRR